MDKERQKREESQQKEENEKRKKGNPEDLSIPLLRGICRKCRLFSQASTALARLFGPHTVLYDWCSYN